MKKLIAKIDVTKINKTKIVERKYTNSSGQEVVAKELDLELIKQDSDKHKFIAKSSTGSTLMKVGFIAEKSVKKEDGTYENGNIIGEIMEWKEADKIPGTDIDYSALDDNGVSLENIPF